MNKGSLSAALKQVSRPTATEPAPVAIPQVKVEPKIQPNRQGKKAVAGYFDPAVSRQLKQIALESDKTLQTILEEAFNDLFEKYGKSKIAG